MTSALHLETYKKIFTIINILFKLKFKQSFYDDHKWTVLNLVLLLLIVFQQNSIIFWLPYICKKCNSVSFPIHKKNIYHSFYTYFQQKRIQCNNLN